jgi:E3 ubiquitin-protein ligase NEDD4
MTTVISFSPQDRVKPQLTELLLGFYDVLPESLLTIFDFHQLELLMW